MTTYKVWIDIEEYDEETGDGRTMVDAPGAEVYTFESFDLAYTFAAFLQRLAKKKCDAFFPALKTMAQWEVDESNVDEGGIDEPSNAAYEKARELMNRLINEGAFL